VTLHGQVNHLAITNTKVNSALHPSGAGKSSTDLLGWGYGGAHSPMSGGR